MNTDNISCKICNHQFDENDHTPLMLNTCGHSLCNFCYLKLNRKNICPFCNQQFSTGVKNFLVMEIVQCQKQSQLDSQYYVDHNLSLNLYCKTDQSLICEGCLEGDLHKGHDIINSTKFVQEFCQNIKQKEEQIVSQKQFLSMEIINLQKQKQRSINFTEELCNEVKTFFNDFFNFIQQQKNEYLSSVKKCQLQALTLLDAKLKEYQNQLRQINQLQSPDFNQIQSVLNYQKLCEQLLQEKCRTCFQIEFEVVNNLKDLKEQVYNKFVIKIKNQDLSVSNLKNKWSSFSTLKQIKKEKYQKIPLLKRIKPTSEKCPYCLKKMTFKPFLINLSCGHKICEICSFGKEEMCEICRYF